MKLDYKITKPKGGERVIADAELHWYAADGHYKIEASGYGVTEEAAKKQASLMLGQARAALHVAMIDSNHRVPEIANAAVRHDDPPSKPLV